MDTPAFIDTDSCHCRLRSFPREATINAENPTRAWHCVRQDEARSPLQAHAEKWFLQTSGEGRREPRGVNEDEGYRLPDTRTWYHTVREEGQSWRLLRASDATELHLRKGRCTGEIRGREGGSSESAKPLLSQRHVKRQRPSGDGRVDDTDAGNTETGEGTADDFFTPSDEEKSNRFSTSGDEKTPSNRKSVSSEQTSADKPTPTDEAISNKREAASTTGSSAAEIPPGQNVDSPEYKYLHSCRRGDQAVAVQIQDNSSWNDVGCLAGFLCK